MGDSNKLPLKRAELSLTNFNEVAIPHHLDLLRQHKANIIKYEESGEWARVRAEQTHARRVSSQLRALLAQMESLRAQVQPTDHARFDLLTARSRDLTLKAIVDYLETSPLSINRKWKEEDNEVTGSIVSTDSVGMVAKPELVQLQVDEHELALREREAVLEGWSELQQEVRALHAAWHQLHEAARAQGAAAAASHTHVQRAADNVQEARRQLSGAEHLAAGAWGAGGAALGALAGGPLGMLVGAKAGAAALVAGSALGYWAARLLSARRRQQLQPGPDPPDRPDKDKTQ